MKKIFQWAISFILFFYFGWDLFQKVNEHSEQLALVKTEALKLWPVFIGVASLFFLAMFVRAHRWSLILGDKSLLWLSYRSISIGYLVQCPFSKLGEIARMANQKKYSSVGMGQIVSTVFIDRLLDVISLIVVLITTIFLSQGLFEANFPELSGVLPKLMLALGLGLLGLFAALLLQKKIHQLLDRWTFMPRALVSLFEHFIAQFNAGLLHCKSPKTLIYLMASNVFIWVLYFFCFYWTLVFFPQMSTTLSWQDYFIVFTIGSIGAIVPVPGGLPYPLFTQQALVLVAPEMDESIALSIALVMYLVNFWLVNLFYGGTAWIYQILMPPKAVSS
jgi:glycosyltransferase 2 family protein